MDGKKCGSVEGEGGEGEGGRGNVLKAVSRIVSLHGVSDSVWLTSV